MTSLLDRAVDSLLCEPDYRGLLEELLTITEAEISKAKAEFLAKKYRIDIDDIDVFADFDPSARGKYIEWLIRMHKKGIDVNDSSNAVGGFDTYSRKQDWPYSRDINQYPSVSSLDKVLNDYITMVRQREQRGWRTTLKKYAYPNVVVEVDDWKVIKVTDFEAIKALGAQTRWCVTRQAWFKRYRISKNRPVYVVIHGTEPVFVFSVYQREIKDIYDKAVNRKYYPILRKIFRAMQAKGFIVPSLDDFSYIWQGY